MPKSHLCLNKITQTAKESRQNKFVHRFRPILSTCVFLFKIA